MSTFNRRNFLVGAGAFGSMGLLAACGGLGGSSGGGQAGTLRYAFWGNNVRQQNYAEAFQQMEEEYPDISINMQFGELDAFVERMTTQMAAGNVADIFWVPATQVMSYYSNGLYRPLGDVGTLDLSDYTDELLADFELDGEHNTMPFGIFTPTLRYNHTFAEEDGVELPDDGDWDWDDLAEFAIDYSNNNSEGRKGMMYEGGQDLTFEAWLRRNGEELWTEDGQVGFTQGNVEGWIEWWENIREAGGTTSVSEQDGVAGSWEDVGDQILMRFGNSNHIIDDAAMFPDYEFRLRHHPSKGAAEGHAYLYYPRMAIYSDVEDEQAELAGTVLTYCTSNLDLLRTTGLSMGVPPNPRLAEEYEQHASHEEQESLRIVTEDRDADRRPRFDAPAGTNNWLVILRRQMEQVVNGNVGISAAAEAIISEIDSGIQG